MGNKVSFFQPEDEVVGRILFMYLIWEMLMSSCLGKMEDVMLMCQHWKALQAFVGSGLLYRGA